MESKELLILNPLLLDDSLEKYIWVNDSNEGHRNAQYLFGYLMKRDIYINGFATSSPSMAGLKMYHKKIVGLDFSQQENTAVFYDIWSKDIWKIYKERGHKARIINPDLDRENIVIWGSGVTGVEVFKILEAAGIKALFFVDSNESLVGTMKCGLPVCSPDALEKNFTVIEAMENWRQLDNEICAKYSKRVHFSFHIVWNEITCDDDGIEKNVLSLSQFWPCNRFEGKKIYVYGTGNVEKTFVNCLKLLDYEFGGFLVDDTNELEESGSLVKNVEEILYEDNYYVWVYDELKNQRLKELGLGYYSEYECAISAYGIATDAKFCIDVNFGHTYLTTSKYSGITVYGEENEKDYKIAVLGGSTTDGAAFPFQSWSRILHEKLWDGITVYNGGVSGYASGQELVKLIRDILPLKPDMVVVYDGFNELNTDAQYPFAFPYSKEVSNYAIKHLDESAQGCYERQVALGVRSKKDFFSNWLSNLRNMYAISRENNIRFFAFCQPELSSKRGKTMQEKNMLLSALTSYIYMRRKEEFRKRIEEMPDLPDYIYDLSHIFDNETDIYMDSCHVWEKGNRIIAEEIAKVIVPEIRNCKGGK